MTLQIAKPVKTNSDNQLDAAIERLSIAAILRRCEGRVDYGSELSGEEQQRTIKVMGRLARCQRGPLGAKQLHCDDCGNDSIFLLSCGDRHCSTCSAFRRICWHDQMQHWKLPCKYLHLVVTVPHDLNDAIAANPKPMLSALMKSARLAALTYARRHEGVATPGIVMMLHTWGQRLNRHYHVHLIVTAGGLNKDQTKWIPIDVKQAESEKEELAEIFKEEYLQAIERVRKKQPLRLPKSDLEPDSLLSHLRRTDWIADIQGPKQPHHDGEALIGYLSHYVTGTAIGNARLVEDKNGFITFDIRDYREGTEGTERLYELEFCRRISYHVLPKGMQRVRYAGLFHLSGLYQRLALCRRVIKASLKEEETCDGDESLTDSDTESIEPFEPRPHEAICPECGKARQTVQVLEPSATMQVLSLVGLMITVGKKFTESDWQVVLSRVIAEQLGLDKPHQIAVMIRSGMIDMKHPIMDFVRIRYEEETAPREPRGPPRREIKAA